MRSTGLKFAFGIKLNYNSQKQSFKLVGGRQSVPSIADKAQQQTAGTLAVPTAASTTRVAAASSGNKMYLAFEDNSFVALKCDPKKPKCTVFRNFTKQNVTKIRPAQDVEANGMFTGAITTADYIYLVHNVDAAATSHKRATARGPKKPLLRSKNALCKVELKDKCDFVHVINKRYYIMCRRGIIELYKLKCYDNVHRIKLIASVNSLSRKVTDMIYLDGYINCVTNDGTFNTYNMIFGKRNEKIYPSFDRAFNPILKVYASQREAITLSKFKYDFNLIFIKKIVFLNFI